MLVNIIKILVIYYYNFKGTFLNSIEANFFIWYVQIRIDKFYGTAWVLSSSLHFSFSLEGHVPEGNFFV